MDPHKTQRLSRDTLFGILATWINPDGARGWRVEGLLESLEPLSAALSILRYLLMQRQDANSSNTDSKRIEGMELRIQEPESHILQVR